MAKGSKNTGRGQKGTAVPASVEHDQAGSTEQVGSTSTKPAAPLPPVKSVSVQSVTNECIALIQQLPRREQTEVFKNIRRGGAVKSAMKRIAIAAVMLLSTAWCALMWWLNYTLYKLFE